MNQDMNTSQPTDILDSITATGGLVYSNTRAFTTADAAIAAPMPSTYQPSTVAAPANTDGIAAAARRLHKNAQNQPKASPLMNMLIKRVVKEQDNKSNTMRWEHLVNMHSQIGEYLLNLTTIASFMRNKTLIAHIEDKELLLRLVKILAKDMVEIQKRAMANAEQYPIKSGEITDDEDMLKAIGIYEVYNQILLDIVNVVMPISNQVMEIFTVAERIIVEKEAIILAQQEATAAAALVDPTVISDVAVKEVVVEETVTEVAASIAESVVITQA